MLLNVTAGRAAAVFRIDVRVFRSTCSRLQAEAVESDDSCDPYLLYGRSSEKKERKMWKVVMLVASEGSAGNGDRSNGD